MSLLDTLIQYSHDICDGKIVACTKHKQACQRFLRDVDNADTEDFPYYFDERRANRFFSWMRMFKHRKGVLRGKYIEPHIIQLFVFGNVYGWYHRTTGYRRFSTLYWQVARKNTKSQSLSCVGSFETMALDEEGLETYEVYCAATKSEQARIVYDETLAMLDACEYLKGKYKSAYGRITHLKTGSFMRVLSEEDRKTGDGLNPQCAIIDEYHAHDTSEIYDVMDSGMGARTQPLIAIITTAGFDLENPCYRVEYDLVTRLLDPNDPTRLDYYFAMVNELERNTSSDTITINGRVIAPGEMIDDYEDENVWPKPNPIVTSYPEGIAYLRKKVEAAKAAPEKMRNLLTKHFNVWVNSRDYGYMDRGRWVACGVATRPDVRECYVGADISAKIDLTSVVFEFPYGDGMYHIIHQSFMPEETFEKRMKTDRVPYDLWRDQGYITVTPGAVVEYGVVHSYVMTMLRTNKWYAREIALDPWGSLQIANAFISDGLKVIDIVQVTKHLSEPSKDFKNMVYLKKLTHENDPVLDWAIGNAVLRMDHNENYMLDKSKSRLRIDPVAAAINAHCRAMVGEKYVYNARGLRDL